MVLNVPIGSLWNTTITLALVVLFALVLPFVCWGRIANPSHSHATPHIVFIDPAVAKPPLQHLISGFHQHGEVVHTHIAGSVSGSNTATDGQSTPQMLFIFSLSFVVSGLLLLYAIFLKSVQHTAGQIDNRSWQLPPPLRPPQSICT